MSTFLNNDYYKKAQPHPNVGNPFATPKSGEQRTPHVNSNNNDDSYVGELLATGDVDGVNNNKEHYLFVSGNGVSNEEASGVDVQGEKDKLAAFNNAYRAFISHPSKETALALKKAYYGGDGNGSAINNKNVQKLYESKKEEIEKLINSQ